MSRFESGVSNYVKGVVTITVAFPIDDRGVADISCNQCPYFRRNYQTCGLNNRICNYPNKYVGVHCPLEVVDHESSS